MLGNHVIILHILNATWHLGRDSEPGIFRRHYGNVAHMNSSTFVVADRNQPCLFSRDSLSLATHKRQSYRKFHYNNATVIFVGETNPLNLKEAVTFCYPWISRLCSRKLAGKPGSECCDGYLTSTDGKYRDFARIFHDFDGTKEPIPRHSFDTGPHACGKCGPWQELDGNHFLITSGNSAIRCRAPDNGWIFRPHEDWSAAFHDVRRELELPYGNQILKVLSGKFNFSFQFDDKFPSEYYGNGFLSDYLDNGTSIRSTEWEGALNALLKRGTLLAIGSVWLYQERDQYFSNAGVFSQTHIELANHVERIHYDKYVLLDSMSPKTVSFFIAVALGCSALVCFLDRGSFLEVFVHLMLMPVAPSRTILTDKRSCVLLAFRVANVFLCIHFMLFVMEKMITPHYRSLFFDLSQVRDHVLRHGDSRVWGKEDEIETIREGLHGAYLASSVGSQLLKEILSKSAYFSEEPSRNELAIFARQHVSDFIFEETKELAYHTNLLHSRKFLHSVAQVNALYETVYLQKGCSIRPQVSKILRRLIETGHINHWRGGNNLRKHSTHLTYSVIDSESMRGVEKHFSWQILFSVLIFAAELASDEWMNMRRSRVPDVADPVT